MATSSAAAHAHPLPLALAELSDATAQFAASSPVPDPLEPGTGSSNGGRGGRGNVQPLGPPPAQQPTIIVSPTAAALGLPSPTDETSTLGGGTTCTICFTGSKSHAAVPCGHRFACGDCSNAIMAKSQTCPMCRGDIMMFVDVHTCRGILDCRSFTLLYLGVGEGGLRSTGCHLYTIT